jgi:hypothetical protein
MKHILKIFALLIFMTNISCEDLSLVPLNSVPPSTFYANKNNLNAGLYGIYDALQSGALFGDPLRLAALSDNGISDFNSAPDVTAFAAGEQVEVTGSFQGIYQGSYVLIQRANLLLDNVDGVVGVTTSELTIIKAEARALRALAYMKLVYLYGDVPFMTNSVTRDEALEISRTDRNSVVDFILTEFAEAASDLNTSAAADGRLTKQAVLGFRAKVMLYEARMGNQSWADASTAITAAVTAADTGGHGLVDSDSPASDYQSLFTEAGQGNSEFIFSVKNNSTDLGVSNEESYSWQAGRLIVYVHQNLADAYDYADGSDYNLTDNTYVGRDPRLSVNIMHEGLTFNGMIYDGTDGGDFVGRNSIGTATNLFIQKFVTTDFSTSFNTGTLDIPVLRYADLLLMQAEALNETGADGHIALNLVRNRAGLPALSGLSQSNLRDEIIHERRVELAFEGQRWFDLITLGIADNVINSIVEERVDIIRGFTPNRNELIPIPQTEIGLNPNLVQNPGY